MEHRFVRIGSLLVIGALLLHVMIQKGRPEEEQNGMTMMLEIIVMGVLGGILFVTWILPSLGDKMSEAMIGSGEEVEETPHSETAARIAAGNYAGAIAEYQKISLANPADRHPVMEIARLYRDKLHDSDSAVQTLHTALVSREWTPDNEAALRLRLADVLAEDRKDFEAAKEQAQAVIDKFSGTPPAGAATAKLHDISEKQYLASREE